MIFGRYKCEALKVGAGYQTIWLMVQVHVKLCGKDTSFYMVMALSLSMVRDRHEFWCVFLSSN